MAMVIVFAWSCVCCMCSSTLLRLQSVKSKKNTDLSVTLRERTRRAQAAKVKKLYQKWVKPCEPSSPVYFLVVKRASPNRICIGDVFVVLPFDKTKRTTPKGIALLVVDVLTLLVVELAPTGAAAFRQTAIGNDVFGGVFFVWVAAKRRKFCKKLRIRNWPLSWVL